MKFNPDIDYATHRDASGGRWFIQNGQRFTVSGIHLGPDGKPDKPKTAEPPKPDDESGKAIRERAAKRLEGFKDREVAGPIAQALDENKQAEAAEEHAP
jgi:hypothetical protein